MYIKERKFPAYTKPTDWLVSLGECAGQPSPHPHNYAFNPVCRRGRIFYMLLSPQRDFITSSSKNNKSQRDTILCKLQGIFHPRLLMFKDIYLEEKVFIMANQRKGAFLKRKIYQEFLQDKQCDPGLCSWRWCVFEDNGNCLGTVCWPPPCWHQAAPYKWAPAPCGGSDKNSQSLHTYLAPYGSPRNYFSALSFVDTALLLANDINRSMAPHLWAVAVFSKSTWSRNLLKAGFL